MRRLANLPLRLPAVEDGMPVPQSLALALALPLAVTRPGAGAGAGAGTGTRTRTGTEWEERSDRVPLASTCVATADPTCRALHR